jgi:hypothetical protein
LANLGCPVGYIDITEGSRAKLGCLVGYRDITEGSRAMLGSPVRYMNITKGYRAKLECPVWYMDFTEGSKAMLGYTEQSNLALEPFVIPCTPRNTSTWPRTLGDAPLALHVCPHN